MTIPPIVRRGSVIIALVGVASLLASCAAPAQSGSSPMQGDWVLVSADDAAGALDPNAVDITLTVDGTTIGGTAGCNNYGGTVLGGITDGDELPVSVDGLFQTEMFCDDDGVMQQEARYLQALGEVDSGIRVDADTMVLRGGDVRLEFELVTEG